MPPRTLFAMLSFHGLVLLAILALGLLCWRPRLWLHLLLLFLGAFLGLATVWTEEMVLPVFLLMVIAAFGAFVQPRQAWLLALLLAVSTPLANCLAMVTGALPVSLVGILNPWAALVPAGLGAALGCVLNQAAGAPVFRIDSRC